MKFLLFLSIALASFTTPETSDKTPLVTDPVVVTNDRVVYKVHDDADYVYVNISTEDKKTSMSILRHGLSIYFDVKGNEDKGVYVKYPYDSKPVRMPKPSKEDSDSDEKPSIDLNTIIADLPGEAEYVYFQERQQFHKDLNAYDIALGYKVTGELFEYDLKIPKTRIDANGTADFSQLLIGVMTNKLERKSEGQNKEGASQGKRGGKGGGGRGQGGGGRGQGGRGQGGGSRGDRAQSQGEPVSIEFWFKAPLSN
ncbi:hypothetical protein [Nonlabens sp. Asnod2-A12]|uniref:hypothetical protein n=1 Tax=Nonlabens sp. Asnod2-A12 TaxID=3160578 RepID=UPI0038668515